MAFFRMGVLRESEGSALMNSWGSSRRMALGHSTGLPRRQLPPLTRWGAQAPPQAPPVLTIICATSSGFLRSWKELPWEPLRTAWLAMQTLCARHSLRPRSCGDAGLQEGTKARGSSHSL